MPMTHDAPIPVAVVGVGRMGRHHARTYKKLPQAKLLAVVDADEERAATVADDFNCDFVPSVDALLERYPQVKAVSVAVPTVHHAAAALPLLSRGVACLVEKPLAPTVDEAQRIADAAAKHNTILQVGHTERFNPAVRAVMAMDITPRFMEVDRISPMTFRSLDVGVVMDMMIHDLDIVLALARSPLVRVDATGVPLLSKHEDVASARLVFESGCVANLTASRLALKTERKLRIFSEDAYVSLDYQKRTGLLIRRSDNAAALEDMRAQLAAGADLSTLDYSKIVQVNQMTMDQPVDGQPDLTDPLTAELSSFLQAATGKIPPEVDGQAGLAAVAAAQAVAAAIANHKWQGLGKL